MVRRSLLEGGDDCARARTMRMMRDEDGEKKRCRYFFVLLDSMITSF